MILPNLNHYVLVLLLQYILWYIINYKWFITISNNWCIDNVALYGSITTSDNVGNGYTENVYGIPFK